MSKASPTSRTLQLLRVENWTACVVEKRLPHCYTTVDAFGLFDVLAVRADSPGVAGVQTTSGANHAARVKKMLAVPELAVWLSAGNAALIWSWSKRKGRWECRRQALTLEDLPAAVPGKPAAAEDAEATDGPC